MEAALVSAARATAGASSLEGLLAGVNPSKEALNK
jgi:hypothetical protein